MKKKTALMLATSVAMLMSAGCYQEINSGVNDILYNDNLPLKKFKMTIDKCKVCWYNVVTK